MNKLTVIHIYLRPVRLFCWKTHTRGEREREVDEPSGLKDSTHLACDPLFRLFVRVLNPPISPASWNRYTHSARLLRECVYTTVIGQQSSALFSTRIEFGFVCSRLVYLLLSFSPLRQQVKYSLKKTKHKDGLKRHVRRPRTNASITS